MKSKTISTIFLIYTLFVFNTSAEVNNGDFELWTSGTPKDWTTIDSGISVNENNSIIKNGTSSAAITVDTASQSSTDFRQNISVVSGQTYDFSTWVYHTEGGTKTRLYIDGYRNYSDPTLTNQWQQIKYSYTASSSKQIEIGLRFYDVTGFDGSEIVYVDDFQPSQSNTPSPPTGSCQNTLVLLELETDNYAAETSWTLADSSQAIINSSDSLANNTSYSTEFCLVDGEYSFTIYDSYGDGICCSYGNGSYKLSTGATLLGSGGAFAASETKSFTINSEGSPPPPSTGEYYDSITTQTGYALKTALYNIIKNHSTQGYSAIWTFYSNHSIDKFYENDGSILDIYSEIPNSNDSYNYIVGSDQCGTYNSEADCYNREHSFPRSWFGGSIEPMNSDIHHIFASDGYVNSKRSSFPYAEVANPTWISANNSKLGTSATVGYSGTVFEPIDEFKGDIARAYFYMATRYQNRIASWENNSSNSNAVLDGTDSQVFESWQLNLLISWHNSDPVSQYEIERNNAAQIHQGNRNPFIDHPQWVELIWIQ